MAKEIRVVEVVACLVCPFNQRNRCIHPKTLELLQLKITKRYRDKLTSLPLRGIASFCPLPTRGQYAESHFDIDKEPE